MAAKRQSKQEREHDILVRNTMFLAETLCLSDERFLACIALMQKRLLERKNVTPDALSAVTHLVIKAVEEEAVGR